VVQLPTTAYSVSGTALIFTGAPLVGDTISVRELQTTASVTSIVNGTSNVAINTTNGNVTIGVGGTSNVLVASSTGVAVTGTLSASGIITGSTYYGDGANLTMSQPQGLLQVH
jgi:NH3-dependent NAD+ synthetase